MHCHRWSTLVFAVDLEACWHAISDRNYRVQRRYAARAAKEANQTRKDFPALLWQCCLGCSDRHDLGPEEGMRRRE